MRVIGVWTKGQSEPWWLATNLEHPVGRIAKLYERRMSIEEQFRDGKGCRFGIKMKWTKFKKCEHLDRLHLLLALALTVCTAAGVLACRKDATLRLPSKSKGLRRSLVAVGIEAGESIRRVLNMTWKALRQLWQPVETRPFAWE